MSSHTSDTLRWTIVAPRTYASDGSVTVWTHSAQSQGAACPDRECAKHTGRESGGPVAGALRSYGRTTLGGDGAEGDAAILSQLTGKPVRVQWTLQEELGVSTVSAGMGYPIARPVLRRMAV